MPKNDVSCRPAISQFFILLEFLKRLSSAAWGLNKCRSATATQQRTAARPTQAKRSRLFSERGAPANPSRHLALTGLGYLQRREMESLGWSAFAAHAGLLRLPISEVSGCKPAIKILQNSPEGL